MLVKLFMGNAIKGGVGGEKNYEGRRSVTKKPHKGIAQFYAHELK